MPRLHDKVLIGRRNVHVPTLDRLTVFRVYSRQRACGTQNFRQHAAGTRGHVQNNEECRRQIGRQRSEQLLKRLHTPGGRADDNNVSRWHVL